MNELDMQMLRLAVMFLRQHSEVLSNRTCNDWDFPEWVSNEVRDWFDDYLLDGQPPPDWVACGMVAKHLEGMKEACGR